MIAQKEIILKSKPRGFHLATGEIVEQLNHKGAALPETGLLHLFIKHTSAALAVNENADPSVRADFESSFNHLVRENEPYYTHTMEGPDDMPAHIKSALIGCQITLPVSKGKLNLGTWQGVYLCEFRNNAGPRTIVATIYS